MKQDNKNSQFLLEIFVEEIPARLVNELSKQLENNFKKGMNESQIPHAKICLLYTSPSPRDGLLSRMPSSA